MKRYLLLLSVFLSFGLIKAQVTSDPSPIVAASQATIIYTNAGAGPFYLYSWAKAGSTDMPAIDWNSNIADAFKFTKQANGTFTFNIASLKSFYKLSDAQLLTVTQLGILVRNGDGSKATPNDLFLTVVQTPPPPPYSGGGNGSISTPYLIANTADLVKLSTTSSDWGKAFKVTAPISSTNVTATIGNSSTPFTGQFNGNNQTITGSSISGAKEIGFFGVVNGATISNVSLRNITVVSTGNFVGALAGKVIGTSTITACSAIGAVTADGSEIGGLIGSLQGGVISGSFAQVTVNSNYGSCIGGFVGLSTGTTSTISDCYASGNVSGTNSTAVGGFAGKLEKSATITNSFATGDVNSDNNYIGGFVGANYSTIQNSFSTTETITSSKKFVGQFGGNNNGENISTNNVAWNGATLASGNFTGYGESATLKASSTFNAQNNYDGVGGLNFTFSGTKWTWDGTHYPALSIPGGQTYPFPFAYETTSLFKTEAKANVTAYPTQIENTLTIVGENISNATITNLVGYTVLATNDLNPSQSENQLDVSTLLPGIYIVRVVNMDGAVATIKVIKK